MESDMNRFYLILSKTIFPYQHQFLDEEGSVPKGNKTPILPNNWEYTITEVDGFNSLEGVEFTQDLRSGLFFETDADGNVGDHIVDFYIADPKFFTPDQVERLYATDGTVVWTSEDGYVPRHLPTGMFGQPRFPYWDKNKG